MVLFNYAIREITAKLVYYGPGLCGKTTNLQFIHEKLDPGARGKLLSLATDGDRTLFFDFLPIEMGNIGGYKVRFQLYTVPGQVHYNATRKLVLKGVDAVVFVADSQVSMLERNRESFENLVENLAENGYELARVPVVIQLNKRDLPNIASAGELVASMGVEGFPALEAVAYRGDGVFETLKTVIKLTLSRLRSQFDADGSALGSGVPALAREVPAPPAPPPPVAVFAPPPVAVVPTAGRATAAAAPAPPVAPAAAAAPAVPELAEYDEFDLENYREIAPGAGEEPTPAAAAPVDLEQGREELTDDDYRETEAAFAPGEGLVYPEGVYPEGEVTANRDWRGGEVAEETPSWAREIQEELQRLREENRRLREALRGLAGVIERQIDVLREGREQLAGAVAEEAGEGAAP